MKYNGEKPKKKAMETAVALLKDSNATQSSVAEAIGCSQGTVSNWNKTADHKEEISKLKRNLDDEKEYANQLASELNELELAMGLGGFDGTSSFAETDY